jgi:hypothetical protein
MFGPGFDSPHLHNKRREDKKKRGRKKTLKRGKG